MAEIVEDRRAPVSVAELVDYWRRVHSLAVGQRIEAIPIYKMPSWDALCVGLRWKHYLLDDGYFAAKDHGFHGVYRLIALDNAEDLQSRSTLNRICGQDTTGTLYIGEASDLSQRLNQLRRSARPRRRESSHGAMNMLRQITRLDYPIEKLAVALMYTDRLTRMIERDLLHSYINTFGDSPPLNYKL